MSIEIKPKQKKTQANFRLSKDDFEEFKKMCDNHGYSYTEGIEFGMKLFIERLLIQEESDIEFSILQENSKRIENA